ncbi:MAG TPA: PQQ-binding-like beta-propeller repeat protein [bacterium]|nr:PQQ-binding-like beta-propeller repeat protein [bacterium]
MARTDARPLLLFFAVAAVLVASSCKRNHPPDVPAVLAGLDSCFTDTTYSFMTTATDPDGDSVQVRIDWGDSTLSDWGGWFASGDTISLTHAWSGVGTRDIKAQARDQKLASSNWSGGLAMRLVSFHLPHSPYTPAVPSGPSVGGQDSMYFFVTTDSHPDRIPVAVRFAWSNGDTSAWSKFVASGESVRMSHAWHDTGFYAVAAQAKDTNGALSSWSERHSITVHALDLLRKWRFRVATGNDLSLAASPAIAPDGTIYVGSPGSALCAVNPDGTLKWTYPADANAKSSPAVGPDGTVYVGGNYGTLYAISPDSGALKWSHSFAVGVPVSSPSISSGGAVFCGCEDRFSSLTHNGGYVSDFQTDEHSVTDAAAAISDDGTVYIAQQNGTVGAYSTNCTRRWKIHTHAVSPTDLAIAGDLSVYFGSEQSPSFTDFAALYHDGASQWAYSAGVDVHSAPAIAPDGTVYFGSTDNCLYALNPDSSLKWRYQTGGDVSSGPAVAADGTIYVGSNDSCLYALNADGTLKWRYLTGGRVEAAPTIGTDGTVYFISDDGYLYALNGTSPLAASPWPKFHHDLQNTGQATSGFSTHVDTVGDPVLAPDSSGFTIQVANTGNTPLTLNYLWYNIAPPSAYMRDLLVNGAHGYGYPIQSGQRGSIPPDTMRFAHVTIAPNRAQAVEFGFLDFHVDSLGLGTTTNVAGKDFGFYFIDGSAISVRP